MLASHHGYRRVVAQLLEAGATVTLVDNGGWTALTYALQSGHHKVVAHLLAAGAAVNQVDGNGWTALIHASRNGNYKVVAQLLMAGATVNHGDIDGCTALAYASEEGHCKVVAQLLEANAEVNLPSSDGCTALMIASTNGNQTIVALLLRANANVNATGNDDRTAITLASEHGHPDVVAQLLAAGATLTGHCTYDVSFHAVYLQWLLCRLKDERMAIINGERTAYLERKCDVFAKPMSLEECGNLGFLPYHQLPAELYRFSSDLFPLKSCILSTLKELAIAIHNSLMERDRAERDAAVYCDPHKNEKRTNDI
jgi:ankyrin repeat protein